MPDAAMPDAAMPDAAVPDAGPELVDVSHPREMRAVWVASVYNINFPSRSNLTAVAAQQELTNLVDGLSALGINAIFFQVRPESDALYASTLEPWSRFLTGTQGTNPGYDPLDFLIGAAHAKAMEVHAWINPYRGKTSTSVTAASNHVTVTMSEHALSFGTGVYMNPGAPQVRAHVVSVVEDIVSRYEVDGIHFDDYFYPYPVAGQTFPDEPTYQAYLGSGGTLSKADWRRKNVNDLVQDVFVSIAALKPSVRFGVSPFGIYRPGTPPGITGLDAYNAISCDPVKWMEEGWVDYLAPQLYWPTTQTAQAYGTLLDWWVTLTHGGRSIFAGTNLTSLGSTAAWTVDEIVRQVQKSRDTRALGSMGNVYYHSDPLMDNTLMVADRLRTTFYTSPALPPPVALMAAEVVEVPSVEVTGTQVVITHGEPDGVKAWVIYREELGEFLVDRILSSRQLSVVMEPGRYAVTAVGLHDVESRGVVAVVE